MASGISIGPAKRLPPGLAFLLVCVVPLAIVFRQVESKVSLVLLLFLAGLVPCAHLAFRKKPDWCEPLYGFVFIYMTMYVVPSVYLLRFGSTGDDLSDIKIDLSDPGFSWALVVLIIGLVMFLFGYLSRWGDVIGRALPVVKMSNVRWSMTSPPIMALFIFSLSGKIYLLATGKILNYASLEYDSSPVEMIISYAAHFGYVIYALAVACQFRNRRMLWFFWLAILPIEVIFYFLGGSRAQFIVLFFIPVVLYHYQIRRLNVWRLVIAATMAIFLLKAAFPIISSYRSVTQFGDMKLATFEADLTRAAERMRSDMEFRGEGREEPSDAGGWWDLIGKQSKIEALVKTIEGVEEYLGYLWGRTLLLIPVVFVPTIIWPTKYDYLSEPRVIASNLLFGYDKGFGLDLGQVAEFYMNFGIVGVVAGMFLLGVLLRGYYVFCHHEELREFGPVIYSLVWLTIVAHEGGWLFTSISNGVRIIMLVVLLSWLVREFSVRVVGSQKH